MPGRGAGWRCWSGAIRRSMTARCGSSGICAELGVAFEHSVVPGITSLQALAAGHRMALNAIGGEVRITTGRRLREAGAPEGDATLAGGARRGLRLPRAAAEEWEICWGAYLGMPEEMLIAGPLGEVGERIVAARGGGAGGARVDHGHLSAAAAVRGTAGSGAAPASASARAARDATARPVESVRRAAPEGSGRGSLVAGGEAGRPLTTGGGSRRGLAARGGRGEGEAKGGRGRALCGSRRG